MQITSRISFIFRLFAISVIVISSSGYSALLVRGTTANESKTNRSVAAFAPATVLVQFKPGVSVWSGASKGTAGHLSLNSSRVQADFANLSMTTAEPVFAEAWAAADSIMAQTDLSRIYRLHLPSGSDVTAAIAVLARNPDVVYAEPDYVAQRIDTPNDPQYGSQWGLTNIGAPTAWDVTTGNVTTTIAIVDSGLDTTHEDLTGKLWVNPGEIPNNGIDDDGNGLIDDVNGWNFIAGNNDLIDENGHGTEVAGVAAAASNNGKGIAGVCWTCRVMIVKVMQSSGIVNYSDVAAGVAYAAGAGAHVINLSLGGYADSITLRTAIGSAAQTAVVVAGAGNDHKSVLFYPAAYPSVIAVAATDSSNVKASFSNFGSWVDAAAPGVNVLTTLAGGNSYGNQNGTSLSAPFVAGVAGLIHSQHPDWSAELVREQLLNTATSIDSTNPTYVGQLGHGLLNASAALNMTAQPQMTVSGWTLDGQANARPDKNKTSQLAVTLLNTWLPARSVVGTLSTSTAGVTIPDNGGTFGDINTGESKINSTDTFSVAVGNSLSYGQIVTFTLNLSGADGYSLNVPFTLQVRSGVVTWPGNATIITNTTWYADQMYVITTTVKVNPGITLTIQPGTVVRSNISGTLRIDGTLIVLGTADQPIVFATYPPATTQVGTLNFWGTSVQSTWDANGQYVSGSVLQHVDMTSWNIGLNSRALSIADSKFNSGTIMGGATSPSVVEAGASHIERNTFTNNASLLLYGGQSIIRNNTFTTGSSSIALNLSGGSMRVENNAISGYYAAIYGVGAHSILSNTLTNNTGTAIALGGWNPFGSTNAPVIHDNYIVGNTGAAINATSLEGVDIEHNLIANNGGTGPGPCPPTCTGAAVELNVQNNSNSQFYPALTYNPDRDEYLLMWSDVSGMNYQIKAQRVLSDGQMAGVPVQIGSGTISDLAYNPTQHQYLTAWRNIAPGGISMQRLDDQGALIGSTVVVTTASVSGTYGGVRVVYDSVADAYWITWQSSLYPSRVYGQKVLSDGSLSTDVISIGSDLATTSVSLGDADYDVNQARTLVILRSESCGTCFYGAWLSETITPSVPSFLITQDPGATLNNVGMAFGPNADRYFLSWDRITGTANRLIYGQALRSDGSTSFGQSDLSSDPAQFGYYPQTAFGAGNQQFLTIWQSGSVTMTTGVYARLVYSDGTPSGNPFPISTPPNLAGYVPAAPALAYNANRNEYLAAWVDARQGPGVIYGQRLSADGQLLDNAWTAAVETSPLVNFQLGGAKRLRYNTILNNKAYGTQISGGAAGQVSVAYNNLIGNATYDVYLPNGTQNMTVTATGNYWGIDATSIPGRIHDCEFDDPNGCAQIGSVLGKVLYDPPLDAPAPEAPGYINAVTIAPANGAPGDPIGIGRATVDVTFSRPMITTTLPSVSFHDARRGTVETIDATVAATLIAQDLMGRMWFGTTYSNNFGVRMFNGTTWVTYTTSSGLGSNSVAAIFGASNGEVWIGHAMPLWNEAPLSRLQGSTWITYTASNTNGILQHVLAINAIDEDATGKIWFGTDTGAVSFDGTTWRRYTTADGLANNQVHQIVRDGQERMWFSGGDNATYHGTLSVFDGIAWTIYDQTHGLPGSVSIIAMFADSRGRVWVSVASQDNTQRIALYDAGAWTYFNNSVPQLAMSSPSSFAEDPDGKIWMWVNGSMAIYDDGKWSTRSDLVGNLGLLFDSYGNLWMGMGLHVLWGGADYSVVDNAQWLSATHFRATYDVAPIIPKGTYVINASGALDSDGMRIAPDSTRIFLVDYAGYVTDGTPPTKPVVSAHGDGTLTTLAFSWSSSDPQSGIDQYRYAIGTMSGGRDVVDWIYVGRNTTSVTRYGLLLVAGQAYYVTVAARNAQGLWSQNGVSNPVLAGVNMSYIYLPLIKR